MPRWLLILIVVGVIGSAITIGAIPVRQRWESTPGRRILTWTGLIGLALVGLAVVGYLVVLP